MKKIFFLSLSVILISCQSNPPRTPATAEENQELTNLVNLLYEKSILKTVDPEASSPISEPKVISPQSANTGFPIDVAGSYKGKWRNRKETFTISRLPDFEVKNQQIQRIYSMDRYGAKDYKLEIKNSHSPPKRSLIIKSYTKYI